jgi:hypothetical protein
VFGIGTRVPPGPPGRLQQLQTFSHKEHDCDPSLLILSALRCKDLTTVFSRYHELLTGACVNGTLLAYVCVGSTKTPAAGRSPMNDPIIVIDAQRTHCRALCKLLEANSYRIIRTRSLAAVPGLIQKYRSRVAILDLDTVPVKNWHFRDLKRIFPDLYVLAVSARLFHPELKEAMTTYIYASLSKPVDPEELIYLVKSIVNAGRKSRRYGAV